MTEKIMLNLGSFPLHEWKVQEWILRRGLNFAYFAGLFCLNVTRSAALSHEVVHCFHRRFPFVITFKINKHIC
jgi:hypothetical protein